MSEMAEFVPVPSIVLDRLVALGVDVDRVLRAAGVLRARFAGTRAKLTVREFFAFWQALETAAGKDLGLRIGARAEPHQLDVASLAAIHSDTLGDALGKFARYKRVVCGEQISVDAVGDEVQIRFDWVHVEEEMPHLLVDTTFASLVGLASHGIGQKVVPVRVELARREAEARMYREFFGCPIVFSAAHDLLVLPAALLDRAFVTRNADVVAMLTPSLESALAESVSASLADSVRAALSRGMTGARPSVEKVAHELAVSPRTLQRRLGELGTSYQELLDEVRRAASRRLLANTDLDAGEIAFLLGFEELNSFSRAFHAWEGATPTRWREAHAR